MEGRFGVAACTGGGKPFEHPIGMALVTGQFGVRAGQREAGFGMIEIGRQPASGCVAGAAILAKLAFVVIILGVASVAVGRDPFEGIVHVT